MQFEWVRMECLSHCSLPHSAPVATPPPHPTCDLNQQNQVKYMTLDIGCTAR